MSYKLPNHPLFNQLCEKASILLNNFGFFKYEIEDSNISFVSKDGLSITIKHEGYDMPNVYIGNKRNKYICLSWGVLEYYIDSETPIFKKHLKLKSFYDFEFDFELINNHYSSILNIINSPKNYLKWENQNDIEKIFEIMKK